MTLHHSATSRFRHLLHGFLIVTIMVAAPLAIISNAAASVSSLYYSASPTTTNVGKTFTVTLTTTVKNTAKATGEVSGKMQFPTGLLTLKSVKAGTYPKMTVTTSGGTITLKSPAKALNKGYTGTYTLVTATFTAKTTGNATIESKNDSMIVNGTNYSTNSLIEVIYAASCPTGQTGTPPSCTTPPPTPTPTPTPTPSPTPSPSDSSGTSDDESDDYVDDESWDDSSDSTAEDTTIEDEVDDSQAVEGITVTLTKRQISTTDATLLFTASQALDSPELLYGVTEDASDETATPTVEGTNLVGNLEDLKPGKQYYYILQAKEPESGDMITLYSGEFTTIGYPVKLTVKLGEKTAANRKIQVDGKAYTTDKSGVATMRLASGQHTFLDQTTKTLQRFTVKESEPNEAGELAIQKFSLAIKAPSAFARVAAPLAWTGLIVLLVGLAAVFFLRVRRRKRTDTYAPLPPLPEASLPTNGTSAWSDLVGSSSPAEPVHHATVLDAPETPPAYSSSHQQPASLADLVQPTIQSDKQSDDDFDPFLQNSPFALRTTDTEAGVDAALQAPKPSLADAGQLQETPVSNSTPSDNDSLPEPEPKAESTHPATNHHVKHHKHTTKHTSNETVVSIDHTK